MKIRLIALIVILSSGLAKAQFSIGPKIGFGYSTFTYHKIGFTYSYTNNKYIITPQVGILINFDINKNLSVRSELLYNQRGYKIKSNPSIGTRYYRINYLEVPIHFVISGVLGSGKLEVYGGVAVAYGVGGKLKYEDHGKKEVTIKSERAPKDYKPGTIYFNPLNVSLNLGFGYRVKNYIFQVSYNYGLTNTISHYEDEDLENRRKDNIVRASAYTLGVAYLFSFKR